jgi:hypothetical protein
MFLQVGLYVTPVQDNVQDNDNHEKQGRPFMDLNQEMPEGPLKASSGSISCRQEKPIYQTSEAQ